ncbi:unnamed protein product, partial [Laminaria digitata]
LGLGLGVGQKRMSALTPSGNGGAVPLRGGGGGVGGGGAGSISRSHSALSSRGLTPPMEDDSGECDSSGGSGIMGMGGGIVGGGIGGVGVSGVGLPNKSPLWGSSTGASETRVDVTPGRLRGGAGGGGGDAAVAGRSERVRQARPRPPSGSIPEAWVEDDDDELDES